MEKRENASQNEKNERNEFADIARSVTSKIHPRIQRAIITLMNADDFKSKTNLMFFAQFAMSMTFKEGINVPAGMSPTAGVYISREGVTMLYNRDFIESLTDEEMVWLMFHEIYHILLQHHHRKVVPNSIIENIAQDCIINDMIDRYYLNHVKLNKFIKEPKNKDGSPVLSLKAMREEGYTGPVVHEELSIWLWDMKKKKDQDAQNKKNGKGKSDQEKDQDQDPKNQNGDDFQFAPDGDSGDESRSDNQGEGDGQGEGGGQSEGDGQETPKSADFKPNGGTCGRKNLDKLFDCVDAGKSCTIDNHLADEVSKEERDMIVEHMINEMRSRGLIHGDIENMIQELRKQRKDYLRRLKMVASQIGRSIKEKSFTRPNRRGIDGMKGRKKEGAAYCALLDTSGSMSGGIDKVLSYIFRSGYEVDLVMIDTEVTGHVRLTDMKDFKKLKLKGFGGTILQPGLDYLVEKRMNKRPLVLMTDGWTDALDFASFREVMVVTTHEMPPISNKPLKMHQIVIPEEEAKLIGNS
jgi:predicted metal-dependent peptidase